MYPPDMVGYRSFKARDAAHSDMEDLCEEFRHSLFSQNVQPSDLLTVNRVNVRGESLVGDGKLSKEVCDGEKGMLETELESLCLSVTEHALGLEN